VNRHRFSFLCLVVLCFGFEFEAMAAKRDFKGLFGSYRREKFTENEANRNDFGVDLMLSTLLPLSSVAKSAEPGTPNNFNPLNYSTFFNFEGSFWFSLAYHWAFYANIGRYSYETRKQNSPATDPPQFHKFEMEAIPGVAGIRYRLSTNDLVPYVSLGIGMAYVHRQGSHETGGKDDEYNTVACGHGAVGLEFFFAPNAGLRVETSAYYFNLPQRTFDPGGGTKQKIQYQSNVWAVRYASGVFFLF